MAASVLTRSIDTALSGNYSDALNIISPQEATGSPNNKYTLQCVLSLVKIALGDFKSALIGADRARVQAIGNTIHNACEIFALCGLGNKVQAKEKLDKWRRMAPDDPLSQGNISGVVSDSSSLEKKGLIIDWDELITTGLPSDISPYVSGILKSMKVREEDLYLEGMDVDPIKGDRIRSDQLKQEGNTLYKSRKFAEAVDIYTKALDIDPSNLIVYNNIGAVHFESEEYQKCVDACQNVVSGLKSDYKAVSRAYSRIAAAYVKMGNYGKACSFYDKSLTEFMDPNVSAKAKEAKVMKKKLEEEAYKNPELAEKAREEGNNYFRGGQYSEAIEAYSEAIRRNCTDPKLYSNRAYSYIKLMAWYEAEKDCDKAISLDPEFVRPKIRKAQVLIAKRDYLGALDLLNSVAEGDKEYTHTAEITPLIKTAQDSLMRAQNPKNKETVLENAAKNPEISDILTDPVIQTVIKQISEDPAAFAHHMKDPIISHKLRTLISSGVLQLRQG